MEEVRNIVTSGLAIRKEKHIKVRQPLAKLTLRQIRNSKSEIPNELLNLIKEELNVKEVIYSQDQKEAVSYDLELTQTLKDEGYARELIRQIQDMRKEFGYKFDDKVRCQWQSDDKDLQRVMQNWGDEIKKDTVSKDLIEKSKSNEVFDIEKETQLAPNQKIWIGIRE